MILSLCYQGHYLEEQGSVIVGALVDPADGYDVGLLLVLQLAQVQLPQELVLTPGAHRAAHAVAHQAAEEQLTIKI